MRGAPDRSLALTQAPHRVRQEERMFAAVWCYFPFPPRGSRRIPESSICTRLFAYVEKGAAPSVLTAECPPRGKYGPRGDMASSIEPFAPPIGSFEQM